MTLEELKEKEKHLLVEHEERIREVRRDYLKSNTLYKVGDVIEDHYHIIQVEEITGVTGTTPYIAYKGVELKKDLTPKKRQDNCIMYQQNVKIRHEDKTTKKSTKEV